MANIFDKIKDKTKRKLYNEARKVYLKKSICNIGRIVETDDKIICYVEQEALDKYKGNNPIYDLMLRGMNVVTEGIRETTEAFRLDKPVYYVFEGIKFDTALKFSSMWCDVIFKNCTFEKNIGIVWGREITFENNKYNDSCDVYFYGDCFLTAGTIKKLTFINEKFVNSYLSYKSDPFKPVFGMKVQAGEVEFINSAIVCQNNGGIKIDAVRTKLDKAVFLGKDISIKSTFIKSTDTSITGEESVIIDNTDCDFDGEVKSPIIFYNGIDLSTNSNVEINVNGKNAELIGARKKLLEELKRIRNYCLNKNEEKVQKYRDELNNETVSRVLRK